MSEASNVTHLPVPKKPIIPEFITARDIEQMTDDEHDSLVAAIRTRRLNSYLIYKQTKDQKAAIEDEKNAARVDKKCEQIIKTINATDKALDKLEQQIAELRGLRLQAGLSLI